MEKATDTLNSELKQPRLILPAETFGRFKNGGVIEKDTNEYAKSMLKLAVEIGE